jgi:hypothetical protein
MGRVGGAAARRVGDLQARTGRRRARNGIGYAGQYESAEEQSQYRGREAQFANQYRLGVNGDTR